MAGQSAGDVQLLDVEQGLADFERWLSEPPQPSEDEMVRQLMRELEVA